VKDSSGIRPKPPINKKASHTRGLSFIYQRLHPSFNNYSTLLHWLHPFHQRCVNGSSRPKPPPLAPPRMEWPDLLRHKNEGKNILCRWTYSITCSDRYLVPPLANYQQEIGDVNQGEVRRGLSAYSHVQPSYFTNLTAFINVVLNCCGCSSIGKWPESSMVFALDLAQFSITTCQVTFIPLAKYLFSIELFNIQ